MTAELTTNLFELFAKNCQKPPVSPGLAGAVLQTIASCASRHVSIRARRLQHHHHALGALANRSRSLRPLRRNS